MRSTTLLSLSAGPFSMSRVSILLAFGAVVMLATAAHASPMSIRIDDHDFSFDVPFNEDGFGAVYDYRGDQPDQLRVTTMPQADNHYVSSYSYTGVVPTVLGAPAASQFLYPVVSNMVQNGYFGGSLEMQMTFELNDGPYVAPSGDAIDISLTGKDTIGDHITITGQIWDPNMLAAAPKFPAPPAPQDIVLLDITLEEVSLMARVNEDRLYLVEGKGRVTTLLGEDVSTNPVLPQVGVTFFKFFAEDEGAAMFDESGSTSYNPLEDYGDDVVHGHISGEVGVVPEPMTIVMLLSGIPFALLGYRRWKKNAANVA